MYIVTGGAGFIGSNLIRGLNAKGIDDILVVDNLKKSGKFTNLVGRRIRDYLDKDQFLSIIEKDVTPFSNVEAIFHQGACTDTMEYDGRYMMDNNYAYSKALLEYALSNGIKFIYASSAATYGSGAVFEEKFEYEAPINVYGYSKYLFDQYVRRILDRAETTVAGLRYFNVYGPHEAHKGKMASVVYQFYNQLKQTSQIMLFEGTGGYGNGEQKRDFIYVDDVVAVNLWFLEGDPKRGIFNVGTGNSRSFNDIARCLIDLEHCGEIVYIPFPDSLKDKYQSFTQADLSVLRGAGYSDPFLSLEEGIVRYHSELKSMSCL
jgi:ADP-L-glycero-D-manno-heptose 6-epimerase